MKMMIALLTNLIAFAPLAQADSVQKFESPVLENYTFYRLVNKAHPFGVLVDAKGGKYIYETCGKIDLIEGQHYSLGAMKTVRIEVPDAMSGSSTYLEIRPGTDCK
jgi:hypothetical protein